MSYFDKVCGTCRHHQHDPWEDEWVCNNEESECYGVNTEYQDSCDDHEEKDY